MNYYYIEISPENRKKPYIVPCEKWNAVPNGWIRIPNMLIGLDCGHNHVNTVYIKCFETEYNTLYNKFNIMTCPYVLRIYHRCADDSDNECFGMDIDCANHIVNSYLSRI